MYDDFYGLKRSPFSVTSDPELFFESSSHKEALISLLYGIRERKGLILITGEVGTGKTVICKILLKRLPSNIKTSLILNPFFNNSQLLQAIREDFGLEVVKKSRLDSLKALNSFLIEINRSGGTAVLIIDEAQNLTHYQLEHIRLLTNLETSQEKLLQIILVGQPELVTKINQTNLRQLRQRIFVKHNLAPLSESEIKDYVMFRIKAAGETKIEIEPASFKIIYDFSLGIPRLINMICDRALLCGFAREQNLLDQTLFQVCKQELE
ncbi:MAG: AAA family ATPase [Candidatus Omnitrophota bacterium]